MLVNNKHLLHSYVRAKNNVQLSCKDNVRYNNTDTLLMLFTSVTSLLTQNDKNYTVFSSRVLT